MRSPPHEVLNQPPPLCGHDIFSTDRPLVEALERQGAAWADDRLQALGQQAGDPAWQERGRQANQNPPVHRDRIRGLRSSPGPCSRRSASAERQG
jgi:putative acyl-CoA dehydrogenase